MGRGSGGGGLGIGPDTRLVDFLGRVPVQARALFSGNKVPRVWDRIWGALGGALRGAFC